MPWWLWAIDAIALVLVLALVLIAIIGIRRRLLARAGTTLDLCVKAGEAWYLGLGRYHHERLEFFRAFSFAPRPKYVFERGSIAVLDRRHPTEDEAYAIHGGFVVIEVFTDSNVSLMALPPSALTGMLAWLESMPPGEMSWRA